MRESRPVSGGSTGFAPFLGQAAQELLLRGGELGRDLDHELRPEVTSAAAAHDRHASSPKGENLARLRSGRDAELLLAVEGGQDERGTERRLDDRHRHRRHQVVAGPRVPVVRLHPQMDIEVARFTATRTDRAAPGEAEGGAVVDAGRHVHLVGLVLDSPAMPGTRLARGDDELSQAPAARAGRGGHHLAQQALAHPTHLAGSGALGAGHRLGARRGALAVTGLAPNGRLDRHGEGRAEHGGLEGDVGLDLEILPTGRAGRAGLAATERAAAEEGVEQVAEPTAAPEDVARPRADPATPASPNRSYMARCWGSDRTS